MINAQEDERKRIARELHDEFGQTLTGLIMNVESMENISLKENSPLKDKLEKAKGILSRALVDLRRLTLALRPSALDDLGLVAAIRSYHISYLTAAGIKAEFDCINFKGRLEPAVETALFRIIQEATHNIVKHAQAGNVHITLEARDGKIITIIEDDGKGFNVNATLGSRIDSQTMGLMSMEERTTSLGGSLAINSQIDVGTRIIIEIPLTG